MLHQRLQSGLQGTGVSWERLAPARSDSQTAHLTFPPDLELTPTQTFSVSALD